MPEEITVTNNANITAEKGKYYCLMKLCSSSYASAHPAVIGGTVEAAIGFGSDITSVAYPAYTWSMIVKATATTISCVGDGNSYSLKAIKLT